MFGRRKLKKQIEIQRRQIDSLESQNRSYKKQLNDMAEIWKRQCDELLSWENVANKVSSIDFKSDKILVPDKTIELIDFLLNDKWIDLKIEPPPKDGKAFFICVFDEIDICYWDKETFGNYRVPFFSIFHYQHWNASIRLHKNKAKLYAAMHTMEALIVNPPLKGNVCVKEAALYRAYRRKALHY